MTTAPDLPLPSPVAADVDATAAARPGPALRLVPAQPIGDDTLAFDEALRLAGPRLKRYAVRRLRDEHEAEEVVQEALLRAFQHRHLLATDDDLMAWLTVVTGRLVIDRVRVRGRSTPVAELPPTSRASRDTADVVVARAEARTALDALEAMPGRQASVLWAREVEGLSYDEIGERFGMTEPSVRSLLHRARRALRREYAARGGTLPGVGLAAVAPWVSGLRVAGRVRHLLRRGAGAATVAATGLAIVTVSPLQAHHVHATTTTPHLRPALLVSAPDHAARHHAARSAAASPAAAPAALAAGARGTGHHDAAARSSTRLPGPHLCGMSNGAHSLGAGCETHHSPTVYVKLPVPVAGNHEIGLSKDSSSKLCPVVPNTAVTECDPGTSHGQPHARPSKGTS